MVENEQKEWWNDEAKPKISPKKWEESLGDFHELVFGQFVCGCESGVHDFYSCRRLSCLGSDTRTASPHVLISASRSRSKFALGASVGPPPPKST